MPGVPAAQHEKAVVVALLGAGAAASCLFRIRAAPTPPRAGEGFDDVADELGEASGASTWIEREAADIGTGLASRQLALHLDSRDRLAPLRAEFHFPRVDAEAAQIAVPSAGAGAAAERGERYLRGTAPQALYFVGNSLGLQPRGVRAELEHHLREWEDRGVEGHFTVGEAFPVLRGPF
eukprot:COSAG01_NODE_2421_length_7726_cov_72.763472_7_plen_179_part_00